MDNHELCPVGTSCEASKWKSEAIYLNQINKCMTQDKWCFVWTFIQPSWKVLLWFAIIKNLTQNQWSRGRNSLAVLLGGHYGQTNMEVFMTEMCGKLLTAEHVFFFFYLCWPIWMCYKTLTCWMSSRKSQCASDLGMSSTDGMNSDGTASWVVAPECSM